MCKDILIIIKDVFMIINYIINLYSVKYNEEEEE